MRTMDWTLTPAQARAQYYVEHVTPDNVDDDLDNPAVPTWPPLLNRRLAAQHLGISMNHLSRISGNGPNERRLKNCKIRGKVFWKLKDIQAYQEQGESDGC